MLVAYGPDSQPVVAEETPLAQLHHWSREHMLYCPGCRGIVHVRGGPDKRTQLHFAHQKGECAWSTESESVRHMRGKLLLSQWLHTQFPRATVTLEERLPGPNRIADILLTHAEGQRWAIEFQCAPLDIDEWRLRHSAYRQAGIVDIWIIGVNRREKQEAFIEAILATSHEILFLDPLVTPARIWLRWPISRHAAQAWQEHHTAREPNEQAPVQDGWVGRTGYGMTLSGSLNEVHLNGHAGLIHPVRAALENRERLIQAMSDASEPQAQHIMAYLDQQVETRALHLVLIPLMKAYLHDPALLQRYNYGRGQPDQPPSEADHTRVSKARAWFISLGPQGFSPDSISGLIKQLPYVGPYMPFINYAETLLALLH